MTSPQPRRPAPPGEVRGAGSGGRTPSRSAAAPDVPNGPALGPAALAGGAVGSVVALVLGALRGIFDLGPGLLVVAAVGGWLIGEAVAWGAWRRSPRVGHPRLPPLAGVLGGLTWLGGTFVAYVLSLALLPASSRTFAERLADQGFPAWLGPQLSLLDLAVAGALAAVAWRSAR